MSKSQSLFLAVGALSLCILAALPGCAHLSLNPFHRAKPAPVAGPSENGVIGRKTTSRGLALELRSTPDPLKLGESRQVQVTLILRNNNKKAVNLKFASSQLEEILLRDVQSGKIVSQWSTDRTFDPQGRSLIVNPQERLEFSEPITTRELQAGKTYSLEAYFIGYDQDLRVSRPIIPQP